MLMVLAAASLAAGSVLLPAVPAEAGSLLIPAWSFARGNAVIHADPKQYADAGPLVGSGPRQPWGWTVEYDIDVPVDGDYTIHICYASAEPRPVQVFLDNTNLTKCCQGVTLDPKSTGQPDKFTSNSSAAKWQGVCNQWGRPIKSKLTKGVHTLKLSRRGTLPHLVALRLDTSAAFPESWKPRHYKVRDINSIPAEHRKAFQPPRGVDVAALRKPVEETPQPKAAGSLQIPAWTFDRGNVRIYASPDQYADAGPLVGNDPKHTAPGVVEYDIDFPVTGEYTLHVSYATAEARPAEVFLDGKSQGKCCYDITFGSAPFEIPVRFSFNSSSALKKWEGFSKAGKLVSMPIAQGRHTLKFARRGPLPNLVALRLDSSEAFPKDWKPAPRQVRHYDSVPVVDRSVFLPADAVNLGALRRAIEDMIEDFGPQYPNGEQYLKQLAQFEKKPRAVFASPGGRGGSTARVWASEEGVPEEKRTIEEALKSLRREAMLAHPALKFDKLLFVKRTPFTFNTYQDSKANTEGGSLCVLSPVSPDGKVSSVVPELDGGIFSRFDLSFDAKKVVFGYKRKDKPFRIYEIEIDPSTGLMAKGSLRQLTFGSEEEAESIRRYGKQGCGIERGFDDMDPCYMPNGQIMFTSTRSQRRVFCNPSIVTTLHLMDADGKNMRCLSGSPLNEVDPCLLDDGRVVYTRWEYIDKGLGNGQSLWTVRPDGSGVEHVYKNSIIRPAQMLNARSIPGSQRIVTVGAPHCGGRLGGPVILVDNRITRRDPEAMDCITPEIAYPCMNHAKYDMGFFREPHPFSEKFFLVSHNPGSLGRKGGYGIYVLDAWGNRAALYHDPEISSFQPTPLRPRRKPPGTASPGPVAQTQEKTGTLFVQDVYEGMTGIERGAVKYLRVMAALPWPWDEEGIFRVGMAGNVHRKKVYGVAKVHEDGSACFTVPAGENVFLQALDKNYMQVQHMPTFINLMPGETRSCIGCHEHRTKAPRVASVTPEAMNHPVQSLSPQPGDKGPRMVHYVTDIQPILNKHCVGCHGGKSPKGHLDLTGETTKDWNRSYESLVGKGLVAVRDCRYGRSGFRPEPPLSFGSHLSKLTERIRTDPCKSKLSTAEFIRITTWIDANSPYLGKYGGQGGGKN